MPKNDVSMESKTFTIAEAAAELGMPQQEIERVIHEGKLAAQLVNGEVQISKQDLEDFREAYSGPPGASF